MIAAAWAAGALACAPTDPDEVAAVDPPAIVVLGERHGRRADLKNAARVVRALAARGPVTVALEAVSAEHQDVLEQLEAGEIRPRAVRDLADWERSWGHPFRAYLPILSVRGVQLVASGPPLGPKPDGAELQVPAEYDVKLRGQALAHGMSEDEVPAFSAAMAWRDLRIAELALAGWSGEGTLVIVAGRGHVAEGLGIPWQLPRGLTDTPVTSALLSRGETCGPADRYLP